MAEKFLDEVARIRSTHARETLGPEDVASLRARVDATLAQRRRARGHRMRLAQLGGIFAIAVATAWLATREEAVAPKWYSVRSGSSCIVDGAHGFTVRSDCATEVVIDIAGDEIRPSANTEFFHASSMLRLKHGRARFAIAPRLDGASPFTLVVSHGQIVVRGTRFDVVQDAGGGAVTVETGSIDFIEPEGRTTRVVATESHRWPTEKPGAMNGVEIESETEQDASTRTIEREKAEPRGREARRRPSPAEGSAKAPRIELRSLVVELSRLRSQGRHRDAVELLERALEDPSLSSGQKERLSFDLATLLADPLGETERSCAHWRAHVAEFPNGPTTPLAAARLAECAP